jgi:hypothetical protein
VEPESAGRPHPVPVPAAEASPSPGGTVALPPLRPQTAGSQDGTGRRPSTALARFLDPAATYNTVLTAPDRPVALALGRAPLLAEWVSRRYTRSPGEAGGGRSDLCHDNDEPDPVNLRGRIGDNAVDPTTELCACGSGPLELIAGWVPSWNEELPADPQEWKPELSDHWKCSKCPRSCHVEGLPGGSLAVVLEARMHNFDVGEGKFGGGCCHPIKPAALRIDQGERRCSVDDGQRKTGQSGA